MITIATLLWDANDKSLAFSKHYDETDVEKLYRGFERNLEQPFRFVVFTERERHFMIPAIEQQMLSSQEPNYSSCIEPYKMNVPMILVGLDTVVTGNVDHLANYCLESKPLALPRAVYKDGACNGVALVPEGRKDIWESHAGENDQDWMAAQDHVYIDDLWPGQVVSYKGHVKDHGLGDARIVFFHGPEKPHEIAYKEPWIKEHWR